MTVLSTLPPGIRSYLDDFVARRRRVVLARAAGIAVAGFLAWMLAWCVLDRFAHLPAGVRLVALAIGVGFAAYKLAPGMLALTRRTDCVQAAAEVERHDPRFGQRLVTVTSRVLGSAEYRGSDDILIRLVREVGEQVSAARDGRVVSLRPVVAPWAACALLILLGCGLARVPLLGLPALAARFIDPVAKLPPVTTTRLAVAPGDRDLVQSQPLTIEVAADRLGDSPVTLHLNDDGRNWTRVVMSPTGGGRFAFALASVDRDVRYYVTAGDAQSPEYAVRVLRRPAVARFLIEYEYPAYTRLAPAVAGNLDGHIEAPAGTGVTLTIKATEPLKDALLELGAGGSAGSRGGEHVLMTPGSDAYTRRAQFVIRVSGTYSVDLISARDVSGTGPAGMAIRAVPDLPPQVRLARGGDSLRLDPRGIVPVWYEAIDDYGVKSLVMRAEVNGQASARTSVPLWGDPRRQQDVFNFDLATLPLGIGDVVKLVAVATDTAGHSTESQPLQVIVSPQSVDLDAWERIGELRNAAQLAASLSAQLDDAVKAQADSEAQRDRSSSAYLAAESKADRALSAASQTATLLRQALLRATTHSHVPQLSVAMAGWIDAAEVSAATADEAFRRAGASDGMPSPVRDRLRAASDEIRQVRGRVDTVLRGEQAAAVLADDENLQAARQRAAPKDEPTRRRLRETVERMRQDVAVQAAQIGIDPKSADLDAQLRARTAAAHEAIDAARPVDFVAACRQWAQELQRDPNQRLGMESRLSAAAQAEAIRPDADLIRARDLVLASRAAAGLTAAARGGGGGTAGPPKQAAFDGLGADLAALRDARRVDADPLRAPATEAVRAAREAGAAARRDLIRLAGDSLSFVPTSGPSTMRGGAFALDERQKDAENLALQASAAAADHEYLQAARMDGAWVRRLETAARRDTAPSTAESDSASVDRIEHHRQSVRREMATAQQLDDLGHVQQDLTGGGPAPATTEPSAAADRQREVADQLDRVAAQSRAGTAAFALSPDNGRERGASAVLEAQDQMSAMPQALASAEMAAADRREAAMRAAMARDAAAAAPPDQRDAADRAAAEAEQNALEALARLTQALGPLSPRAAERVADRLEPFAPETDAARAAVLVQLEPALRSLAGALNGDDATAVDRAANDARRALEGCQRELAAAQDALVQRDPLVAARWYAKAAANSLALLPPDVGSARARQANASAAIWRAWDQSIHRAATERLAAIPSMAAVFGVPAAATTTAGAAAGQGSRFAAAREWGRLRPPDAPDVTNAMHDADPPGYEESLKLYFEALGKAQGVK